MEVLNENRTHLVEINPLKTSKIVLFSKYIQTVQ